MSKVTLKNTKNDILQAYNDLMREKNELLGKLRKAEAALKIAETVAPKTQGESLKSFESAAINILEQKLEKYLVSETQPSSNGSSHDNGQAQMTPKTLQGIIQTLSQVGEGLGVAVSQITDKLALKADKLAELRAEIEEQRTQLRQLYQAEGRDGLVEELIASFEQKEEAFALELRTKTQLLDDQWETQQDAWQQEYKTHQEQTQVQAYQDETDKQRDLEKYDYDLQLGRELQEDEYSQKQQALQKNLDEQLEQAQEGWDKEEKTVADREADFEKYKKEYEEVSDKLNSALKKAEAEGKAIAEKDARVKAELLAKEVEAQESIYQLKVDNLQQTLTVQQSQIDRLNARLETTMAQVQSLAIKAIDGSAQQQTLQSITQLLGDQLKAQPKGK
jgi:hypothetical protein